MNDADVIIIGAGATGLMAACILSKSGKKVIVLEARSRIGGRIHTLENQNFSSYVELGAEFIHGNLPLTVSLLKEAGIGYHDVGFEMWQHSNGLLEQSDEFVEGWDTFLKKLNQLQQDMPMHDFLQQNFGGKEHVKMRSQIENYVAGYDTADIHDASAFALRNEWSHENEHAQHRVEGGYSSLMHYLALIIKETGNKIVLNTAVKEVIWKNNGVAVITTAGAAYQAAKFIVALPLGVLQAPPGADGAVRFNPPLLKHAQAINNIGFGSVIKILLEFDEIFWECDAITQHFGANLYTMGFLFTKEEIPTYWTQSPAHSPLLTGWLGGPPAYKEKDFTADDIMQQAIASLSNVFKISAKEIKNKLVAWHVANWTAEPFTRGSYAYDTVNSPKARSILKQPVQNTLYFAGEYLYEGPAMGTVEAALTSGKNVAENILRVT